MNSYYFNVLLKNDPNAWASNKDSQDVKFRRYKGIIHSENEYSARQSIASNLVPHFLTMEEGDIPESFIQEISLSLIIPNNQIIYFEHEGQNAPLL